jgi:hypothetical protein
MGKRTLDVPRGLHHEGRVHRFVDPQLVLDVEGVKVNCIVGFHHDDIWGVE